MSTVVSALALLIVAIGANDPDVGAGTTDGGLAAHAVEHEPPAKPAQEPRGHGTPRGPSILLGEAACPGADQAGAAPEVSVSFCQRYAEPSTLTLGHIRRAFTELQLPAATLIVQPPDGLTLVNFDTNFYTTTTQPIRSTVTLLGHRITLEATPTTYHWTFGDGAKRTTTDPGAPYPRLTITHNYLRKGTYRPTLASTYTGRYRTAGNPWQQIPGTVTIHGTGQPLRAIEAKPKLVAH